MRLARAQNIRRAWEDLTDDDRRDIVNEAIDKIVVSAAPTGNRATMDGIAIHWKDWVQEAPSFGDKQVRRRKAN